MVYNYRKPIVLVIFSFSLLFLLGFFLLGPSGIDDIYITYWSSYTLSEYGGILNYNFEHVEQSSSLLQVIIVAILHSVTHVDLVVLGYLSSILFGFLSVLLLCWYCKKIHTDIAPFALLLTSTSPFFVYWSFSGSDAVIAAFALLWWILASGLFLELKGNSNIYLRLHFSNAVVASCVVATVRPEMPIVMFCVILGVSVFFSWQYWRFSAELPFQRLALLGASVAVICITLFISRIAYFGQIFPQPVYAKAGRGLEVEHVVKGIGYTLGYNIYAPIEIYGLTPSSILIFVSILSIILSCFYIFRVKGMSSYSVIGINVAIAYVSFIVLAGGDWAPARRFWVPILPVLFVFVAKLVYFNLEGYKTRTIFMGALLLIQGACWINTVNMNSKGTPVWSRKPVSDMNPSLQKYSWFEKYNKSHSINIKNYLDIKFVSEKIIKKKNNVVISNRRAGVISYYLAMNIDSENITLIDPFGLTTKHYTECSISDDREIKDTGIKITTEYALNKESKLKSECGIPYIDIFFPKYFWNQIPRNDLDNMGFTIEKGKILVRKY